MVNAVPQLHHSLDTLHGRGRKIGLDHDGILPVINLAVHHGVGEIADGGICWNGFLRASFLCFAQIDGFHFADFAVDMRDRLSELFREVRAGDWGHSIVLPPVLRTLRGRRTQHHFRVTEKVSVDGKTVPVLAEAGPFGRVHYGRVALLQKDNIRHHIRPGVCAERIVGEADRAQQLRALCEVLPRGGVLRVQGVAAGDKRHNAARTHLIERLGEKVVMNGKAQLVISRVIHLILSERDIADGEVKEITRVIRLFVTAHIDSGFWIKLLRDAPGNAVQLHAVELGVAHAIRQEAEEIADTAGGLQHVTRPKAHIGDSLINSLDDGGACVMRVQRGGAGRAVFLVG